MAKKNAISPSRAEDFPAWFQAVVKEAEVAELAHVRGSMVIRPWGYATWELMQRGLDGAIKETGAQNAYFPLFIPLNYFEEEAEHVEGFAKEMAVVTHHRLEADPSRPGKLKPAGELAEPLIVRPTSETVIGKSFAKWIDSYRDLPLMINQWANVVRWEMRPRVLLRTTEFLWQEGHTAHATEAEAREETERMLEVYREFAESHLAIPVLTGEKPAEERFPGAVSSLSIEAMMQDGKALQAGTSHYLGTSFAEAANIRFQDREGGQQLAHTTSWGVSTRMVGALIMTHGDDDGLRVPPALAPQQVVILPMLRDNEGDAALLAYCDALRASIAAKNALDEKIRVLLDSRPGKAAAKRWDWVRRGAPVIIEVGPRDMEAGTVSLLRRDALWGPDGKPAFQAPGRDAVAEAIGALLEEIQQGLFAEARDRRDANIAAVDSFEALAAHFGEDRKYPGWAEVQWSRPTGAALDAVTERLKALKLTFRNVALDADPANGPCLFTGEPAVERIYVARAY